MFPNNFLPTRIRMNLYLDGHQLTCTMLQKQQQELGTSKPSNYVVDERMAKPPRYTCERENFLMCIIISYGYF